MKNEIRIDHKTLSSITGGCITYALVVRDRYLYVGTSRRGLKRLFDAGHPAAAAALKEGASLIVIPCSDYGEALKNERRLLEKYKPALNGGLDRPKMPVIDSAAVQCKNKKCLHRWTRRTLEPQRCPKCGRRLELQVE